MALASPHPLPQFRQVRPIFITIISVVWLILYWSFGALVIAQLPGEGALSVWTTWRFFVVGFLPVLFFGAPATLIGILQQHLAGAFVPPALNAPPPPPLLWQAQQANNPWFLGFNRLLLFWLPAVLVALGFLLFFFPDGVERKTVPLVLAGLGAVLAGIVATTSSHTPFLHEIHVAADQRGWRGSFFSYLFWRHGLPWGVGNGVITTIIASAVFPLTPEGGYGAIPASTLGIDTVITGLMLCFFMAVSAHPHAWVDAKLGVIRAPASASSPARPGRVAWFTGASLGFGLLVVLVLKVLGIMDLSFPAMVAWKGISATVIASIAAMVTAHWTLARERA